MRKTTKKANKNLTAAKKAKNDEFYTQLTDIEKELQHYKKHFKGKTVLCNCDDPMESGFVKYFALNFEHLGLKKLIATHYKDSKLSPSQPAYKLEYTGDKNGNSLPDLKEFTVELLDCDGDFRSPECESLLEEADIVVTNPPFSLFREYVDQLMLFKKKFLVIGNTNAITYKGVFEHIKDGRMHLGCTNFNVGMFFRVPDNWEKYHHVDEDGNKIARVSTSCWFTNLSHSKQKEKLTLFREYSPELYPKYDNYDAIEVSKVALIPKDFEGVMGVPITFLDKYNPEQFEIVWTTDRGGDGRLEHLKIPHARYDAPVVKGKGLYKRIFIRHRNPQK